MELSEDLKLPEQTLEEDSKISVGEERVMGKQKKKLLAKQKKFEYHEIEGKEIRKKEEVKVKKKDKWIQWIIIFCAALFLVLLYFWLLY